MIPPCQCGHTIESHEVMSSGQVRCKFCSDCEEFVPQREELPIQTNMHRFERKRHEA